MPTYQAEIDEPKAETPCECGSCDWKGPFSDVAEIDGCSLTPGDPSPAGRCPECDALVYPVVHMEAVLKARIAALEAGLRKIVADNMPSERPSEESYDDMESAYGNGIDVGAWDICTRLNDLLDGAPAAEAATLFLWSVYAADDPVTPLSDHVIAATEAEAIAKIKGGVKAEQWVRNTYECDACEVTWTDDWTCSCDDECHSCGVAVSPTESDPIVVEG